MITTDTPRPALRRRVLTVHRWLSIGAAIFWLLQAISGVLIVFHWEITENAISQLHRPTDIGAIERRIDTLAPPGGAARVQAVWTAPGVADRYAVFMQDAQGEQAIIRLAGDGTPVHKQRDGEATAMDFLVGFHHDLLGSWGSWIVSISGILLFSNLLLGLITAWPRRGGWRSALVPIRTGPAKLRLYSWHRAIGLWAVVPALFVVGTGTLLKFEHGIEDFIGAEPVSLPANPATGQPVGFAAAARAALGAIPGSRLTAVTWPSPDDATYTVRVRAPGEIRRAYGASIVLIDANSGGVRGVFPIADADAKRSFMMALFPIHTGELGGLAGRLLLMAVGLWLISMIVMGTLLWTKRRKSRVSR